MKKIMISKNISSDESGYIVVETVGTFTPFILLVISILSLVNIVTLQARVHNALTQAACSISMYSYALYAAGMAENLSTLDSKAKASGESINSVLSGIESLSGGNGFDAKAAVQNILNYGAGELRSHASMQLVRPIVSSYLANGSMTGDEYLSSVRVINFDFTECVIIDRNGNIKLTVEYEIEYTFGALKLPFGPALKVTQTAVTKAWLGGSGEGYRK